MANIGVHGRPATLHLEDLWIRNVTITTGLVDTATTPTLLRLLADGQLDVSSFLTHRFPLPDILQAYEVFGDAGRVRCAQGSSRGSDMTSSVELPGPLALQHERSVR